MEKQIQVVNDFYASALDVIPVITNKTLWARFSLDLIRHREFGIGQLLGQDTLLDVERLCVAWMNRRRPTSDEQEKAVKGLADLTARSPFAGRRYAGRSAFCIINSFSDYNMASDVVWNAAHAFASTDQFCRSAIYAKQYDHLKLLASMPPVQPMEF
jgi:hypothetical protein